MLLTLLVACLACPPTQANPGGQNMPTNSLCYAFTRGNDIWTVCQGKRERISVPSKVSGFALLANGSYLAYYTMAHKLASRKSAPAVEQLVIVSLGPGFTTTTSEPRAKSPDLIGTCGTVLVFQLPTGKIELGDFRWSGRATNVITGESLVYPPSDLFRCSSDRRVVAAWKDAWKPHSTEFGGTLTISIDNKKLKEMLGIANFDLSPNGKYLHFTQDIKQQDTGMHTRNCVTELPGQQSCLASSDIIPLGWGNSVSDSGQILYHIDLDKSCGDAGFCIGLAYWSPGMAKGEVIETEDTGQPQWITPQMAARLHEWSSTLTSPSITNGQRTPKATNAQ
jgi:hypothetical protein